MHKLIVAEKPSLGMNIISAIGSSKFSKKDGYYESQEYIVTWAFGHLFRLLDIEEYKPKDVREEKSSWTLSELPFKPEAFQFTFRKDPKTHKTDSGVRKQFGIIKTLCSRSDVECVISAGDADREGEIIIRIILDQAQNKKPVMRLWMPDQTPETIRSELRYLKNDSQYDALANEGYARTYIDWLYGINLTRLASTKSGTLLRVGRIIIPIVKAIYDRDMAIRTFTPQKYLGIQSKTETNGIVIPLISKHTFDLSERTQAKTLCSGYNRTGALVQSIDTKEKIKSPGKLYSLSKLQGVLGKKYKMSPKESLAIVQSLYDSGYVTYPRTNSEYLATAEQDKINSIVAKLKLQGYKVCPQVHKKSIYNDSKIESHSALTPTAKLVKEGDLKPKEWQVYRTILERFLAVFCSEECRVSQTSMVIRVGDLETFSLNGETLLSKGWMQYDDPGHSDKILPNLKAGERVNIQFQPIEKETAPPKHYTVETLNNYLKNPFRQEQKTALDDESDEPASPDLNLEDDQEYKAIFEGVELGTEATRTSIIENAIRSNYIALKNNTYTILPGGEYLIETVDKLGIHMEKEKTAELGRSLKRVYRGEISIDDCVALAFSEVQDYFDASAHITLDPSDRPKGAGSEVLGQCPKCGGSVVVREKVYGCENKDCTFVLWKNHKLIQSLGFQKLDKRLAKALLACKPVLLKNCVSAKTGNTFNCTLTLDASGDSPVIQMSLANADDLSLGNCPKCGSPVLERAKLFGCSNRECRFAIWKEDKFFLSLDKKPTAANVKAMLSKGKFSLKDCTSKKSGKKFDCEVHVDFSGQYPSYKMFFPRKKGTKR